VILSNVLRLWCACVAVGSVWAAASGPLHWEAESLARKAVIQGGGDLVLIHDRAGSLGLSGGGALCFTPVAKGHALVLPVDVSKEGLYRVRTQNVLGPSGGRFCLRVGGRQKAGQMLWQQEVGTAGAGLYWGKVRLREGRNTLVFACLEGGPRGSCLVLDEVWLVPVERKAVPRCEPPPPPRKRPGERLGPELVQNGGFEVFIGEERFTAAHAPVHHWRFNSPVPRDGRIIVLDPAQAHEGRVYLRLAPDEDEDSVALYQSGIQVEPGGRYRVRLAVKGEGPANVSFYQYPTPKDAGDTLNGSVNLVATPEWHSYEYDFVPSLKGKVSAVAIALWAGEYAEVFFDDVSLRRVAGPPH